MEGKEKGKKGGHENRRLTRSAEGREETEPSKAEERK